jgi:predicted enzyme related to lactoylglutathione lyase
MPRVIHFEIPAVDPKRAAAFYKKTLGWKITQWGTEKYWMVETGAEKEPGINGGLMVRKDLKTTVNTVDVPNLDKAIKKVLAAGGKVARPKIGIPKMGWLAYCKDTEGNVFGMMEMDAKAR